MRPGLQLSAAVFRSYPSCRESVGKDWKRWLDHGYLDFVCPMNYANDLYSFTALLDQQLAYPEARGRIVSGIGVTASESQLRGDQVIEQILALRKRGVNAEQFPEKDIEPYQFCCGFPALFPDREKDYPYPSQQLSSCRAW